MYAFGKRLALVAVMIMNLWVAAAAEEAVVCPGRWQSEPMVEDTESMVIEFDFKTDTTMVMSFITTNKVPDVGECVSKISVGCDYFAAGPLYCISCDKSTASVEILKLNLANGNASNGWYRKKIKKEIEEKANVLFKYFDSITAILVYHDSPDTISFVIGDATNAIDIVFHRCK